ncbi:hypothetical protein B0H21DRAFT_156056 [Amylocystis lapponica]|nr:hypothetical protein B0H21DRAFT_156056 [Amylocystis lapponica]
MGAVAQAQCREPEGDEHRDLQMQDGVRARASTDHSPSGLLPAPGNRDAHSLPTSPLVLSCILHPRIPGLLIFILHRPHSQRPSRPWSPCMPGMTVVGGTWQTGSVIRRAPRVACPRWYDDYTCTLGGQSSTHLPQLRAPSPARRRARRTTPPTANNSAAREASSGASRSREQRRPFWVTARPWIGVIADYPFRPYYMPRTPVLIPIGKENPLQDLPQAPAALHAGGQEHGLPPKNHERLRIDTALRPHMCCRTSPIRPSCDVTCPTSSANNINRPRYPPIHLHGARWLAAPCLAVATSSYRADQRGRPRAHV